MPYPNLTIIFKNTVYGPLQYVARNQKKYYLFHFVILHVNVTDILETVGRRRRRFAGATTVTAICARSATAIISEKVPTATAK